MRSTRVLAWLCAVAALSLMMPMTAFGSLEPQGTRVRTGTLFSATDPAAPGHHPSDSQGVPLILGDRVVASVVDLGFAEGLYDTPRHFTVMLLADEPDSDPAPDRLVVNDIRTDNGDADRKSLVVEVVEKDVSAKYRLEWQVLHEPAAGLLNKDAVLNRAHSFAINTTTDIGAPQYPSILIEYLKDGEFRGSVVSKLNYNVWFENGVKNWRYEYPATIVFPEKGQWTVRVAFPERGDWYAKTIEMPLYVNRPKLTIYSEGKLVSPTRSNKLWGYLTSRAGNRLTRKVIYLQKKDWGSTVWVTVKKLETDADGRVTAYVRGTTDAVYRFHFRGTATMMERYSSSPKTGTGPIWVDALRKINFTSAPKMSTYAPAYGQTYKVWGYFTPKHSTGSTQMQLLAYKKTKQSDGTYKYVYQKTFGTKVSNPSGSQYSKYTGYMKLPSKGEWRIRVRHLEDSKNAKSYTEYRDLTVK